MKPITKRHEMWFAHLKTCYDAGKPVTKQSIDIGILKGLLSREYAEEIPDNRGFYRPTDKGRADVPHWR